MAFGEASGKPPLFVIITAHPALDASSAVLPNGSSILEQVMDIWAFLNHLVTILLLWKPKILNLL